MVRNSIPDIERMGERRESVSGVYRKTDCREDSQRARGGLMDTADTKKEAETRGWELQREAEEE